MKQYPLDEFVSCKVTEDKENGTFRIILEGAIKYSSLISKKIEELKIAEDELKNEK